MKTNLKHNYKLANKHEFVLYLYVKLWMAITKLKQYNLNVKIKMLFKYELLYSRIL